MEIKIVYRNFNLKDGLGLGVEFVASRLVRRN